MLWRLIKTEIMTKNGKPTKPNKMSFNVGYLDNKDFFNQNLYSNSKSRNLGNNLYSVIDVPMSLIEKFLNFSVLKRFLPVSPKVNLFSISLYRASRSKK
jgi:hypothetical protein